MLITIALTWTLTYWYFGIDWFIIGPLDFVLIIIFVGNVIKNLLFWIANYKEFRRAWLPLLINLFTVLMVLCTPSYKRNKRQLLHTNSLAAVCKCRPQLYLESYLVYGQGAWGSDLEGWYLTDKKTFRVFLNTVDQADDLVKWDCNGDAISFTKYDRTLSPDQTDSPLVEKRTFKLSELIAEHRFE